MRTPSRIEQMANDCIFIGYCQEDGVNGIDAVCKGFMQERDDLTIDQKVVFDAFWALILTKIADQP